MWAVSNRLCLAAVFAIAGLAGCENNGMFTGGPCVYETDIIEATVTESDEDGAYFEGPDGEFHVPERQIRPVPAVGETLAIQRERITNGSCVPTVYSSVETG